MVQNKSLALKAFFLILAVFLAAPKGFSQSSSQNTKAEPYLEDEFPDWAKDLRHAEIVGFGSMPFVNIGVTLVYGTVLYATGQTQTFPNPFNKASSSFTSSQTKQIFGITLGTGIILGTTDFCIRYFGRKNAAQKLRQQQEAAQSISVSPLTHEEARELLISGSRQYSEDTDKEGTDSPKDAD